jgi:hypothetical protein
VLCTHLFLGTVTSNEHMIDKTVAPIRATFSALTFVKPTLSDLSQPGEAHVGGKLDGCTTTRGTKTPAMKGLLGVTIRSHIYLSFIYHIFFRYSCLYWAFHLVKVMKTVTGCQVFCKKNLVCVNFYACVCQFFYSCVSIFLLTPTSRPQRDLFKIEYSRPYILYSM